MTTYCENSLKSIVSYTNKSGILKKIEFKSPITVEIIETPFIPSRWRYGGSGVLDCKPYLSFEFEADGEEAYIASSSQEFNHEGCTVQVIFIDGKKVYGVFFNAFVTKIRQGKAAKCDIKIISTGTFSDEIKCGTSYEVDCGECPEGYLKCKSKKYPGYCCIPCKPFAQKINSLANKIRS